MKHKKIFTLKVVICLACLLVIAACIALGVLYWDKTVGSDPEVTSTTIPVVEEVPFVL